MTGPAFFNIIMQAVTTKPYTPIIPLSVPLPPDEDLELIFVLSEGEEQLKNTCGAKILVMCYEQGIPEGDVELFQLIWKNCGVVWTYEPEVGDIIIVEGKIIEVHFYIYDYHVSNTNDYELLFTSTDGTLGRMARGRIYVETTNRINVEPPPDEESSEEFDEWSSVEW